MNQWIKHISLLTLLTLASLQSMAQGKKEEIKVLSTEQGLSQSVVTCILQDSRGFMWFGTQDGLNKYDGYEFTVYRYDEDFQWSISGNFIRCIFEDASGNLWIGTDRDGLNKYDREQNVFFRFKHDKDDPESISDNCVLSIAEDHNGNLLIGTQNGLNTYDRLEITFADIHLPDSIPPIVKSLLFDKSQRFWVGTESGVLRYNNVLELTHIYQSSFDTTSLSSNEVHAIFESNGGEIFIGTRQGLNLLDEATGKFIRYYYNQDFSDYLEKSEVQAVIEDNRGNIWVGTFGGGLIRVNLQTYDAKYYTTQPDQPGSLSNDYIFSLYIDDAGLLWIGTYGSGINKLEILEVEFNHLSRETGTLNTLPSNEVYSILVDSEGNVWIGTDMGLCRYDVIQNTFTNFVHNPADPFSISNDEIYCILEDKNQNLWFGTAGGGLNKLERGKPSYDFQSFQYYRYDPDQTNTYISDLVNCIEEDAEGNLWAGTAHGLIVVSPKGETIQSFIHDPDDPASLSHNEVYCVIEDREGTIWLGTYDGLNKYLPGSSSFKRYYFHIDDQDVPANNTVYCLFMDTNGMLWFGTDNRGLYYLDPENETFHNYTTEDGLPDNVIYSILEDSENNFWLSSNHGLTKAIRHTDSDKLTFINYNTKNWLKTNTFNIGAFFEDKNGTMYFGGSNGIVYFNPEKVQNNRHIPEVAITDFQLFYEPVEISSERDAPLRQHINETKSINLKHTQNVISFEFASLNYIQNEKNQYAYMLEGFDRDWRYTKNNRSATYTNLDPGQYTFRVKASNSDGLWNDEGSFIDIRISPPFTRTIWFYILVTGIILLIIYATVHFRTTRLRKLKNTLEKEVAQRTAMLSETNTNLELEIMERKKIEDELKFKNVQLNNLLENLKKTQAQLVDSEKMASLGQLTAGVAHEINNPINFVSGNVAPLKRDIDDILKVLNEYEAIIRENNLTDKFKDVESVKKEIDYLFLIEEINSLIVGIEEGAHRTTEIVKGLRNFSRLDENEFKSADIHEGIDSALLILRNKLRKNIEVIKDYGDLPRIQCFPGQLNQVFMNILNNAIQAIKGEGKIWIKTIKDDSNIKISIRDSGRGIEPDVQKRIFEPFYTTKGVGKGTGLGLSISYGIIEKHNGKITVKSEPGKGSEFIITLPRAQEQNI